jgi:hypothetical protein
MKAYIIVRTQFEALHNWPDVVIPEVEFLKDPHRHVFHVKMKWEVEGLDREKEFILLRRNIDQWIRENWESRYLKGMSCEMIAVRLMDQFEACFVEVNEDGENGAEVIK